MQRRRRVEDDLTLLRSLQRRSDDLSFFRMGGGRRRRHRRRLAGTSGTASGSRSSRDEEDARRRTRSHECDRDHPPGRRRNRIAGLGGDAAPHVPEMVRAPGIQARRHRLPAGRRSGHQERHHHSRRRLRIRAHVGGSRRASAGQHFTVRSGGAATYLVRLGLRVARASRGRRHRD